MTSSYEQEKNTPEWGDESKPSPSEGGPPLTTGSNATGASVEFKKSGHFLQNSGQLTPTERDLSTSMAETVDSDEETHAKDQPSGSGGLVGSVADWRQSPAIATESLMAAAARGMSPVVNQKERLQYMTARLEAEGTKIYVMSPERPSQIPRPSSQHQFSSTSPERPSQGQSTAPPQIPPEEVASPSEWTKPSESLSSYGPAKQRGRSMPKTSTRMDTSLGPVKRGARTDGRAQIKRSQVRKQTIDNIESETFRCQECDTDRQPFMRQSCITCLQMGTVHQQCTRCVVNCTSCTVSIFDSTVSVLSSHALLFGSRLPLTWLRASRNR